MSTLTGTKISETYEGLLKTLDTTPLSSLPKEISDGLGNASGVKLDNNGNVEVANTIAFGSLKDTDENITVTKFVDEADGIENNDDDTSIPTSAAVKDYVDDYITAQDLDFSGNSGTGDVDLDSEVFTITGSNGITTTALDNTLDIDGSTLQTAINTNTADISTNTGSITTNATNIATNETDIATNASIIATNETAIESNRTDISTNATNIANNVTNIANNVTNIATNGAIINSTRADVSINTSNIATNTADIVTNTDQVAVNTQAVYYNGQNIATKVSKSGDTMTGNLTLGTNGLVVGGFSSANILDDYEEGTYNIQFKLFKYNVSNGYNSSSFDSWSNYSYYVKVGRKVTLYINLHYTNPTPTQWGDSTLNVGLGNLPFQPVFSTSTGSLFGVGGTWSFDSNYQTNKNTNNAFVCMNGGYNNYENIITLGGGIDTAYPQNGQQGLKATEFPDYAIYLDTNTKVKFTGTVEYYTTY